MTSLGIDGLISGLDTTSIINAQIAVDAIPQTLLRNKATSTQTLITAFQTLNNAASVLADTATATAKASSFDLYSTTTSSSSVTATATRTATPGTISFTVDQVASAQTTVTAAMKVWADSPPVLTLRAADGTLTEVTAATTSLADVASAINGAAAGYSAIVVSSGVDGAGDRLYRLQISATHTGAAGAFSAFRGSAAAVTGGTATDLMSDTGAAQTSVAQDASITLWGGTAAAQVVTSATNSFGEVVPGVSFTVSAVAATPVTITTARDTTAMTSVAKSLVDSLTAVFSVISAKSAVTTSTSAGGVTTSTGGPFTGDSTVRTVNASIFSAASGPVNGRSPSEIGLTVTRSGTIEFDAARFGAALEKDAAGTAAMVQAIAARVATAAATASNKRDGMITGRITGQQSLVTSLNDQVLDWDRRLAMRRSTLAATYSALEVQLSKLQSQSTYLTSQLNALSTSTSQSE